MANFKDLFTKKNMFNDERLKELAIQGEEIAAERLQRIKEVSDDIRMAEELLNKMILPLGLKKEFDYEVTSWCKEFTLSWGLYTSTKKRLLMEFTNFQKEKICKPLDEMPSDIRLNIMPKVVEFVEYVIQSVNEK